MKLTVNFELPINSDYSEYLNLIAKLHGWNSSHELSEHEFVCKHICEKQVSDLFKNIIGNAISGYFGMSGLDKMQEVIEKYEQARKVTAKIEEEVAQ